MELINKTHLVFGNKKKMGASKSKGKEIPEKIEEENSFRKNRNNTDRALGYNDGTSEDTCEEAKKWREKIHMEETA
jgi:hypothetical protein